MRRGAAGLLLGIVVMLAGAQPASSAPCWFGCKTPPTTKAPTPAPTVPAPVAAPAPAAPAAFDPASAAQRVLDLINADRAAAGLPGMSMRADANAIAQAHSSAMAAAGTIWHNAQFLTQATRQALAAVTLGENVGMGGTVDQVHVAFMNSPGHRANIVEPVFSIVGVGVVRSPSGVVYVTQNFVQPSGATPRPVAVAKPKAAPQPVAPKPRVASTPKPAAAPATTAPPTTEAPVTTTTTTVAAQPDSSVLAAFDSAPRPAPEPAPHSSGTNGLIALLALGLVAASATGTLRLRLSRRA